VVGMENVDKKKNIEKRNKEKRNIENDNYQEAIKLASRYDFYYEYSDDYTVWKKGIENHKKLKQHLNKMSAYELSEFSKIWDERVYRIFNEVTQKELRWDTFKKQFF
jgi:hypothetical protein